MSTISPENLRFASTILAIGIISSTDLTQPHYVLYCRIAFALTQAVFLLLSLYVYSKINEREDGPRIRVPNPQPWGATPGPDDYTEMTVKEYDLDQLKKFVQQLVMSTLIISFLSYKMEVVPPLLFTFLSAPAQFLSTNIFKAYFLETNLERPFKEETSAFMKLFQQYMAPAPAESEQQSQEVEGSNNAGAIQGPGDDDSSDADDEKEPDTREDEPPQVSTPRLEEPEDPKVEDIYARVEEPQVVEPTHDEQPKVEDIYAHVAEEPKVEQETPVRARISEEPKVEPVKTEAPKRNKEDKKDKKKKDKKGSDDSSSSSSSSSSEDEKSDKKKKQEKKQEKKQKKNK